MTERPFRYSVTLLEACATSKMARNAKEGESTLPPGGLDQNDEELLLVAIDYEQDHADDDSCLRLFRQHAAHYGRDIDVSIEADSVVQNRYVNFLRSVGLVYDHNQCNTSLMKLSLNRFSDYDHDVDAIDEEEDEHDHPFHRHLRGLVSSQQQTVIDWEGLAASLTAASRDQSSIDIGILTELTSVDTILHLTANLGIGKGSMNALHTKKHGRKHSSRVAPNAKLHVPSGGAPVIFETPQMSDPTLDGTVLSIKKKKKNKRNVKHGTNSDDTTRHDDDHAWQTTDHTDNDAFATRIDWSTTNNPDGVPIVHASIDQGLCGSCWALAATGSLEASAARREANEAFQTALASRSPDDFVNGTLREKSIEYARQVEMETFHELDLSVQELIDCDQSADQGCTGGNPLLAFYFIHRYGLTSSANYPYVGEEEKCRKDLVKAPMATVQSWGIISPNHEDHMELVLRNIGPIAVGVNGADPAFRSYCGGIFDRSHCKQGANHALLITGYDQEIQLDGSVTRYWIARNSWGTGWGINGYIKMIRGDGRKGTPGICGIARSPSVALGGQLLSGDRAKRFAIPGYVEDRGPLSDFCFRFGLGRNLKCLSATTWIDGHHAYSLGFISIACTFVAFWILSRGARRRRRRRRELREQKREQERLAAIAAAGDEEETETALLLSINGDKTLYGLK